MSVLAFIFTMGASTVFAQVGAAGALKIGVLNQSLFADDKGGVTKLLNAQRALNLEFQPAQNELALMETKLDGLQKELATLREAQEKGNPPVDAKTVKAKEEEFGKLYNEYQAKGKALEDRSQQRQAAVLNPIFAEIGTALNDYAKQKGFSIVLSREAVFAIGDDKLDITKDFITYFNARPAAPAAPVK